MRVRAAAERAAAAAAEGDAEAARTAVAELAALLPEGQGGQGGERGQAGGGVAARLPATHWLRHDAHAATLGAARVLDSNPDPYPAPCPNLTPNPTPNPNPNPNPNLNPHQARVLDDPGLIARSALALLQAREAALPY